MMDILYWIIGAIVLITAGIMSIIIIKNRSIQKRKNDILKLFSTACSAKGITDYKLEHVKKDTHDFYFESEKNIYYIKVIYNFSNQEICINNAIKWQLRKFGEQNNEAMSFVEGVEPLMRLDLTNPVKKEHKLFIVYPNVTALLKVINECEMVFIYPNTDVYGSQVIPYKKLVEDMNLLEI
ncbi:MAG: hypothetical protein K2O22_03725 [Anaeroplasmataceae bacterium]|nr:hypothetical protein [Anaeroplasmataceae bacterium]